MKFRELKHQMLQSKEFASYYIEKDVPNDIAQMVEEARVIRGVTQKELAKKIGTKQSAIARIENGHLPSITTLRKITKALNMTFIILV